MKKILKAAVMSAVLAITVITSAICVSAETEDVELSVRHAEMTNGEWGQSVSYAHNVFDCGRINEDTIIEVEFELGDVWTGSGSPIEIIFHNYTSANPQIWAQIKPFDTDKATYAKFNYEDMVNAYGDTDFSTVDNLFVGDCSVPVKATKVVVRNCDKLEETTTTAKTTTAAKETEAAAGDETTAPAEAAETAAPTTTAASTSSSSSQIPLIPIIIVTVVVAGAVVVIIIVVKSRRKFY